MGWSALLSSILLLFSFSLALASYLQSYTIIPAVKCAEECTQTGHSAANWTSFAVTGYFENCIWAPALFDVDEAPSSIVPDQVFLAATIIKGSLLRADQVDIRNASGVTRYAHYGNTVVGVWVGRDFDTQGFAIYFLQDFIDNVDKGGIGQSLQMQICGANSSAAAIAGIIADTTPGISAYSTVKSAMQRWSRGQCAEPVVIHSSNGQVADLPATAYIRVQPQDRSEALPDDGTQPLQNQSTVSGWDSYEAPVWRLGRGDTNVKSVLGNLTAAAYLCVRDESWRKVDCRTQGITQINPDQAFVWRDTKASAAWCSVVTEWQKNKDGDWHELTFPESVGQYLAGYPKFLCNKLSGDPASDNCLPLHECRGPERGTGAAAQKIMDSVVNIHQAFTYMYLGLVNAQRNSDAPLTKFTKTFTPKPDKTLEIILNILGGIIATGTATWFNSFLKPSAWGNANKVFTDNAKDYTRDLASMALNFGKDAAKSQSAKTQLSQEEWIRSAFSNIVNTWIGAIVHVNRELFRGNDWSLTTLSNLLKDGNSLNRIGLDEPQIRRPAEKLLYSMLVLATWRQQGYSPVLVDTGGRPCGDTAVGTKTWASPRDLLHLARICVDEKQYHMLATHGVRGCSSGGPSGGTGGFGTINCNMVNLSVPPGLKSISVDHTLSDWGDMNIYTMIDSAYASYKHFGGNRKVTGDEIDKYPDMLHAMISAIPDGFDISMLPGLIDIPICAWDEIEANWRGKTNPSSNPNYPCNSYQAPSAGSVPNDGGAKASAASNGLAGGAEVLSASNVAIRKAVKPGTKLRILGVGDSITVGFPNQGDGNGYRLQLSNNLAFDEVVFVGDQSAGSRAGNYFAAWSGRTIKFIADHVDPSLKQRPNIVLLHAGTNDMNPNRAVSAEGNDPNGAVERLGALIDQIHTACPDATILVAVPISSCLEEQGPAIARYQSLIPQMVHGRRDAGYKVLAVDFSSFPIDMLADCLHPSEAGYRLMGDYWYAFLKQIPEDWIWEPIGQDPEGRGLIDYNANGGIDSNIPAPDWGPDPIVVNSKEAINTAALVAGLAPEFVCNAIPHWYPTGKIALGLAHTEGWHYSKNWVPTPAGELAPGHGVAGLAGDGLYMDPKFVRLHDMDGDGKADYLWIDPQTGRLTCHLNKLPGDWIPAGNGGIIARGAGPARSVYFADLNGDGKADYLVVNPETGAVDVWWNWGADETSENGWRFVHAGQIAAGVPHSNFGTLHFPDINGDGRADYVYAGVGGALNLWLNHGSKGGQDVRWIPKGGIATGASPNISKLIFGDINGDRRDDYLIWDDDGGLTGFLNQPTRVDGMPYWMDQGPPKSIADGVNQGPDRIRLADMDGDGKDDYSFIGENGAIWLWWNRGSTDDSVGIDGLRFADIDGDGIDDYIWLEPHSGAPTVFTNVGPNSNDVLGWFWKPLNDGKPIATGVSLASNVHFGDVNGDGLADYLVTDPKTGALTAWINEGPDPGQSQGWKWRPIGNIASGLGPGKFVHFADIDGDGYDDYILLHPNSGTTIYRNVFDGVHLDNSWNPMPDADAPGIGQRPEEITFKDVNGDGKADYIWTRPYDGVAFVHYNQYPNQPTWPPPTQIATGVGMSGAQVRWAIMQNTGRASYLAVDPNSGAVAAWLNGCDVLGPARYKKMVSIFRAWAEGKTISWKIFEQNLQLDVTGICTQTPLMTQGAGGGPPLDPPDFVLFTAHGIAGCVYQSSPGAPGRMICPGVGRIVCTRVTRSDKTVNCPMFEGALQTYTAPIINCRW